MPKIRGMTSLEIAIIVAIVLIIAIAVAWYIYTTFAAATQQAGLTVIEATVYLPQGGGTPTLVLNLVPQGGAPAYIGRIEIGGKVFTCQQGFHVGKPGLYTFSLSDMTLRAGQTLTGRIVLTGGSIAPFTATVVIGNAPTGTAINCS